MATEVTLPALGESVSEGTISRWLKAVGDTVEADEPLLEVSTDKVDTEIPSPAAGTLLEIRFQEDDVAEVGAVLAIVGDAAAAPAAPAPASDGHGSRKISTFLKISIILLAALSIASISLLFIGDFEGKFERVFSTFFAFAVFVGLTTFDTRRGQRNEWYPPVALIANSYILALLLIVIWMTPSGWSLVWDIFWKSIVVIIATRAVVGCSQLLLNMAENRPKPLGVFALITSLLATLTGILFTAPIAIEVFDVEVPELYWRFAVAALLLTALGLSISLLLRWSYGSADREAARRAREQALAAAPYPQAQGYPQAPSHPLPAEPYRPEPQQPQQLLPWPTFPDGRPLPAGPDGQPDFSALNR